MCAAEMRRFTWKRAASCREALEKDSPLPMWHWDLAKTVVSDGDYVEFWTFE